MAATPAAAPHGSLRPLPAPGGCIGSDTFSDGSDCVLTGRALWFVHHVTLSPDGRNLYAAAGNVPPPPNDRGAIAVFARNRRTGELRQLEGKAGCVKRPEADNG